MDEIKKIEAKRARILDEMKNIHSMRRGTVNEQYFQKKLKNKPTTATQGPYYVFTRSVGGQTKSCRLKKGAEVEQAKKDVLAHKKFCALCQQFEELTERLGQLQRLSQPSEQKKNDPRRYRKRRSGRPVFRSSRQRAWGRSGGVGVRVAFGDHIRRGNVVGRDEL